MLAWLGKRDGVAILDGGLKAWHAAGLPLSLDAPSVSTDAIGPADPRSESCGRRRPNAETLTLPPI